MSEAAAANTAPTSTPAAAPAAPAAAPPPSDNDVISSAGSFHEFQAQVRERLERQAKAQNPTPPKPVEQPGSLHAPGEPAEVPEVDPAEEVPQEAIPEEQPVEPTPEELAAQQQAEQQAELDTWNAIKEWMTMGGEIPEVLANVPIPMPDGSTETLKELKAGFMRRDESTRNWQETQRIQRQSEQAVNAYKQHFDQIEDPDPAKGGAAMYEVYTRGKRRAAFMEAAKQLARDEQEDLTHAEGYAFAFARRERLLDDKGQPLWQHRDVARAYDEALKERERIRLDRDLARERDWENMRLRAAAEERQRAEQQAEYGKNIEKQLEQLRPRAFKALGIPHDSENQQIFRRKLAAVAEKTNAQAITPELVLEAARETKEFLEWERSERARRNGNAPPARKQPFTPKLGAGGGKIAGNNAGIQGESTEDFARRFNLKPWQT